MTSNSITLSIKYFLSGVILLFACYSVGLGQNKSPYKQIRIPLNIVNGVPYYKGGEGYVIWGFDIDSNENFYFSGGLKANLACFSKEGKSIYKSCYLAHHPGPIHTVGKELYLFESWNNKSNTLIVFDKTKGTIIRAYPNTITKALESHQYQTIQDYKFSDSSLSITYTDGDGTDKSKIICFNLKGELLPDGYICASDHFPLEKDSSYEYLGKLGDDYVLGKFNDEEGSATYDISLRDRTNTVISNASVKLKYIGNLMCGFYCAPSEHRKLRNNKLYMLGIDKNMAVITEIDLAKIFQVN